jgi:site-specific recombinase XerC
MVPTRFSDLNESYMQSSPITIDANTHFEHWLDNRDRPGTRKREQLTHAAAKPYRYIWKAWVTWLTMPRVLANGNTVPALVADWTMATAAHVLQYLACGVEAAASARRGRTAPISEITRRRYWRVLQMIYAHAVNQNIIAINPVMATDDVTPPRQEYSEGMVLLGAQWQAVKSAITIGESTSNQRDRAILTVLMDAGLTTGELASIRLDQVGYHLTNVTIRINGSRRAQQRDVVLGLAASAELRKWIELRKRMTTSAGTDPGLVFISNRGRPMSNRMLFQQVSNTVARGLRSGGFELPQHIGLQVLRNSQIVTWLNDGVPVGEVCRRAGLKDFRSLRGLRRHINPDVLPASSTRRTGDQAPK